MMEILVGIWASGLFVVIGGGGFAVVDGLVQDNEEQSRKAARIVAMSPVWPLVLVWWGFGPWGGSDE